MLACCTCFQLSIFNFVCNNLQVFFKKFFKVLRIPYVESSSSSLSVFWLTSSCSFSKIFKVLFKIRGLNSRREPKTASTLKISFFPSSKLSTFFFLVLIFCFFFETFLQYYCCFLHSFFSRFSRPFFDIMTNLSVEFPLGKRTIRPIQKKW